jgi:hypothetical protein
MKFVAKFPFQGDTSQGQLSFPVGAVIVQTTDEKHSPRNGWMPVGSAASAPPIPEANLVLVADNNNKSTPVASAIAVPDCDSTPALASISLPPPIRTELDENQISQLMQQGFTRGLAVSLHDSNQTFAKR